MPLLPQVGRHLRAAGMIHHVALARRYWAEVRADVPPDDERARGFNGHWTRAMIVTWAGILKIPPYENLYPVHPRGIDARKCAGEVASTFTAAVFPWGAMHTCSRCRQSWLELDRKPPRLRPRGAMASVVASAKCRETAPVGQTGAPTTKARREDRR
jgi:hypothetical protein